MYFYTQRPDPCFPNFTEILCNVIELLGKYEKLRIDTSGHGSEIEARMIAAIYSPGTAPTVWSGNRPIWFVGVRRSFYYGRATSRIGPVPYYKCGLCHLECTIQGIQIDHIIGWRELIHLYSKGSPISTLQAKILYNAPDNLRALCSWCNQSHPEIKNPARTVRGVMERNVERMISKLSECVEADPDTTG